jgi:hypothetical protein
MRPTLDPADVQRPRPLAVAGQPTPIETAYDKADAAIQKLVDLLAA